jgi:hypothetical protein
MSESAKMNGAAQAYPDPTALESVLQADALLAALEVKADE